jgi:hypothetical protein
MQMLHAGGMPILSDDRRPADSLNPHGYFEYEPVRRIDRDSSWLPQAEGKAVKIVSPLLPFLPSSHAYRILIIERDLDEILRSQTAMLATLGRPDGLDDAVLRRHFEASLRQVDQWLRDRASVQICRCRFEELLTKPLEVSQAIARFLEHPLDVPRMASAVDPETPKHRAAPASPASVTQRSS